MTRHRQLQLIVVLGSLLAALGTFAQTGAKLPAGRPDLTPLN